MRRLFAWGRWLLGLLLISQAALAQFPFFEEFPEDFFGGPLMDYDAFTVYDPVAGKGRLDVYYSCVYDVLQFVRVEGDTYRSRYEASALLRKEKGGHVEVKSHVRTVTVGSYPETNSRSLRVSGCLSFWPEPGKYTLELRLTDLESNKSLVRTKTVTIWDFSSPGVHLSDVLFADSTACSNDSSGTPFFPALGSRFTKPESGFVAIVQVVPVSDTGTVALSWSVATREGRTLHEEMLPIEGYRSRPGGTRAGQAIHEGKLPISGYRRICLPLHEVARRAGQYELRVRAELGKYKAETQRVFSVAWGEAFVDTSNLDVILDAMRYIAKSEDVERMKQASPSLQRLLFEDFWKQRDPTPDTPENELRDEFFRRLDFANRHFSVPDLDIEGWRTDRGRIYIIYGHPTHVEKEPAQMQQASYEVWYYSHLHKRFTFVDNSGNGLYELKRVD
jgi:GWxTD domain-containing protein